MNLSNTKIVEKLVLVNKDGEPVKKGDVFFDRWDEPVAVVGWREPHKPSSTGRIYVQDVDSDPNDNFAVSEFFPSVYGCKFVEDKS